MIDTSLSGVTRPTQLVMVTRASPAQQGNDQQSPSAAEEVTLSAQGLAMSANETRSKQQLEAKFQRIYGPNNFMSKLSAEIGRYGKQAPSLREEPVPATPERLAQSRQVAQYVAGAAKGLRADENPYAHLPRKQAVAIMEDESGIYTQVERYAARAAIHAMDNDWVRRNELLREHEPDLSQDIMRTLDYIDELSELEFMRYPPGYRDFFVSLLNQSQTQGEGFELPKLPSLVDILRQMDELQKAQEPSIEPPD